MKDKAQFKFEIRRQSGKTIAGTLPAGQEKLIPGSARICIEEQSSGQVRIVSLHLDLLQEDHWIFDGLDREAPVRVYVAPDQMPEKMTALYLFSDWWTRPAFVERFEDIPQRTQVLLLKGTDSCACLVPMVGREWKAAVNGGTENELCLELSAGVGGYMSVDEPLYILAQSDTVSGAVHSAFTWLAREKGIPMRQERRIPEVFRSLGWCSWNASTPMWMKRACGRRLRSSPGSRSRSGGSSSTMAG